MQESKQQQFTDSIATEKTKQVQGKLSIERYNTQAINYQIQSAKIKAETEQVKVAINAETYKQTQHQLTASRNQTSIASVNAGKSQDALNAANADRVLTKMLLQENLKTLALQATAVKLANDSQYESLKIASGKIPQLKAITI